MKKTNIIILLVFLLLSFCIGINHEPWVDEAQSWIIARDASVFEIVGNLARYEGAFPLWHLTLKIFIALGLTYEYIFIVPLIISAIGISVFLKKVDAPKYVKILLPFTYFVFYQYTIIARSYCYLLLAISLLLITYKKRLEKPLKYILSLSFISLISMHGMIVAITLVTTFFIEVIKQKNIKKYIISFIIFGIIMIVEIIILFPPSDLYMTVSAVYTIPEIIRSIFHAIIGNGNLFFKVYNAISVILLLVLFSRMLIIKNKDILITCFILILFMFIIRFASHHAGIIYLLIIFGILSNYEEIKSKTKNFDILFFIVLVLYCILSVQCGVNDYLYTYSGSKEMAQYIENNIKDKNEIVGFGYKSVALQPYFEENLYVNHKDTIYKWSTDNTDFYTYCNFEKYDKSEFTQTPKYILLELDEEDEKLKLVNQYIETSNKYDVDFKTDGRVFFKNSYSEKEGYILYKLIEN